MMMLEQAHLTLPHGEVFTPIFMPVGTYGAVRGLSNDILGKSGSSNNSWEHFPSMAKAWIRKHKKKRGSSPVYQLE